MRFLHKCTLLFGTLIIISSCIQFIVFDRFFLAATDSLLLAINEKAANNSGSQLLTYFQKIENSLRIIASDPRIRNNQELLNEIATIIPEVDVIAILDKQGNISLASGTTRNVSGLNLSQRYYFQQAIQGKTYISDVYTSPSGRKVISIAIPIIESGNIEGVVVGVVQLHGDILASMFDNKSFGRGGSIAISDRQGNIVYHPNKERIGKKNVIVDKLQGVTGSGIMKDLSGFDRYIGFSKVSELDWIVSVNTPTTEIMQTRNMIIYEILTISLLAILVIVAFGTYTVRQYSKPIDKLIEAFSSVKKGEYKQIASYDYATEFDEMIQVYNNTIIKLEEVHATLEGVADLDGLTGAYNRRAFDNLLGTLTIEVETRALETLGILLLDIDNFKWLNDTDGHLAGDDILKKLTVIMQSIVGDQAVFRFGGDEFAIILRNISYETLMTFAEEIRSESEKTLRGCTISIGIAICPEDTDSIDKLLDFADKALYISKETKNKVTAYGISK